MILSENSQEQKKYKVYNFIYGSFKIGQNYSLVFQVRVMVTTGEISGNKKRFEGDDVGGVYPVCILCQSVSQSWRWLQQ